MKTKIQNFIILALVLSLCSCSSDDGDSSSNADAEGAWELSSISIETAFDFDNDGLAQTDLFDETPCYQANYVRFESDGSARIVSNLTFISADVTSPTDYAYVYECLDGFDIETTWTQSNNTVTLQLQGNDIIGTISGDTMTVVIPNLFEIELYDGMNYTDVMEDVTLVYNKV